MANMVNPHDACFRILFQPLMGTSVVDDWSKVLRLSPGPNDGNDLRASYCYYHVRCLWLLTLPVVMTLNDHHGW